MTGHTVNQSQAVGIAVGLLMFSLFSLASIQAGGQNSEIDPLHKCPGTDGGVGDACLAPLSVWNGWTPTEPVCRSVGKKVDAIIEAGGEVKWADLFRNERCARLGLPHGVAAMADVLADENSPFVKCVTRNSFDNRCMDELDRHSFLPPEIKLCSMYRDTLSETSPDEEPLLQYPYKNERCWRRGFTHYEPGQAR